MPSFEVSVEYPPGKGKNRILQADIGGGTMSAEKLGELYERTNTFPGASKVSIVAMTNKKEQLTLEQKVNAAQGMPQPGAVRANALLANKLTPKATVVPTKFGDEGQPPASGQEEPQFAAGGQPQEARRGSVQRGSGS
jgi:hypothetical protein